MRKQKSFLTKKWSIAWTYLIMGILFIPGGFLGILGFRPGNYANINGVYRAVTESEALLFGLFFGGIFGGIGLASLIFGFITLKRGSKRKKEIELLKREGMMVVADVTGCEVAKSRIRVNVNGRTQVNYELTCSYQDLAGKTYILRSDLIRKDPTPFLEDGKVNVYCDRTNMKPYFVDIDGSIGLGSRVIEL